MVIGSVNKRNFVPVSVWKQVRRNFSVSRYSRPDAGIPGFGSTLWLVVVEEEVGEGLGTGIRGVMVRVMAWTLDYWVWLVLLTDLLIVSRMMIESL